MNHTIYRLLGIEPGQDTLRADRVFFVQPWPLALACLVGLAFLAWATFFYLKDGTRPSWWWKGLMLACRVAGAAVIAAMLWQPMLRSERVETTPSIVAVLLDESRSMGLRDQWRTAGPRRELIRALGTPSAASLTRAESLARLVSHNDSAALRALLKKHTVRVYRFGGDVTGRELAATPELRADGGGSPREALPLALAKPAAEQTRIGSALDFVLQDTAGQPLAAVVLLSDGGQNGGEDPTLAARRVSESRVPIYTLGFGDPQPPQDLAVSALLADEVVRKGDEVVVSVSLRQRGYSGRAVPLTLRMGDRVLQRINVTLAPEGKRQELNLTFTPDLAGARTLTVSIPEQPGEVSVANNQRSWPIRIIDKKLKILYVEGRPRWEYRYLKNAILRDQTVLFACILVDADPSLGGEGNVPIFAFPRERKDLFSYDIVILGDVPRNFFTVGDLRNLRGFVEERGGSLITMAGEVSLPWEYRNTDLEAVWPIAVPATRREVLFREPFQLELTDAGTAHPMLLMEPEVERNRQLWHSLPGMFWAGVAERAKPGATVLAQHPRITGANGKIPLLAVQQVGEGTSFMTMVDSTWQWRYRVGDKYFYRFWGQVVRSLTPHELPGANRLVRLNADRTTYSLGEKVVLRARLLTPAFLPVREKEVAVEMERTDGQRYPMRLEPVQGAAGVYSGEWLPTNPGTYKGILKTGSGQQGESLTSVVVEASSLEFDEPQQNEALLRRLAAVTGGKYVALSAFDGIPTLLPNRSHEVRSRVEHALWSAPLPLVLFLVLLTGEWLLRKKTGLL